MTKEEAERWLCVTARSKIAWQLDQIHNTVDDSIIYKGGTNGFFLTTRRLYSQSHPRVALNRWVVQVGTYEGAMPHIGEAVFTVIGSKAFESVGDIIRWLREKNVLTAPVINALESNSIQRPALPNYGAPVVTRADMIREMGIERDVYGEDDPENED